MVGSRSAAVDFLQQYNVSVVVSQNFHDPLGRESAVNPDRLVNVVCQQAEPHQESSRPQRGKPSSGSTPSASATRLM